MNVPVLRKTIRLANLPAATVAVRAVLAFDKGRVHFTATLRLSKGGLDLFVRAKYRSIINFRYTSLHSRLVDRCINQLPFRTITRSSGPPTSSCAFGDSFFAECFKNRLDIRSPFIARYQPWSLEIQTPGRVLNECFRFVFRSFAVDDFQHEFVLGIKGDVIPVVTASRVSRIVFVTVFLFLFDEVPLLVELNLLRQGGKIRPIRREAFRRDLRRSGRIVRRSDNPFRSAFLFCEVRFLRQDARRWKRLALWAVSNRKAGFLVVRKISFCTPGSTAVEYRCFFRTNPSREYYLRREDHVSDSFYSHNKSFSNRP